ncbi:hypothetical protein RvY_16542 [Ramazzottius varieornatus]|uniref:Rieske domain-containing protein n=1 Tax=Ramazzottius varieornatus TaxID=947166 RepID=A0A1D1W050_RAMVA|nr:hypothetical protein RvY_16542 [Ramazzottius varieornatus]
MPPLNRQSISWHELPVPDHLKTRGGKKDQQRNALATLNQVANGASLRTPLLKNIKIRCDSPDHDTLPSRPKPDEAISYTASTFQPFGHLPLDPNDQMLWWKVGSLDMIDFQDWNLKIHQPSDFASMFCGVVRTSPYYEKITSSDRKDILACLSADPQVFDSIAEHFEARMNNHDKRDRYMVDVNGYRVGILRHCDALYAIENRCPHQQGPLAEGDIEEINNTLYIVCPWHHWRFELDSGKSSNSFRIDRPSANIFPARVVGGTLLVGFAQYNPVLFAKFDGF